MAGQAEQPTRIRCQKTRHASPLQVKGWSGCGPHFGGQILKSPEGEGSGQNPASWFLLFPWRGTEPGPHKMFCTSSLSPPSNSEPCSPCLALAPTNLCTSLLLALYSLLPFQEGFDVFPWGPPHSPCSFLTQPPSASGTAGKAMNDKERKRAHSAGGLVLTQPTSSGLTSPSNSGQ